MMNERSLRSGWAAAAALTLLAVRSGDAGPLKGSAELQYLNVSGFGLSSPTEKWVKIVRLDYARRLPAAFEFSSHVRFSEESMAGRPDRARSPEATLRLAHLYGGMQASYRPIEARDSRGITTREQELSLTGYLQRGALPRLNGSWSRHHVDATARSTATASVRRRVSGLYSLGPMSFRAGYGDHYLENEPGRTGRAREDNQWDLGSSAQFQGRRGSLSLQYDFSRARAIRRGFEDRVSRLHAAALGGNTQLSRRTSSSLAYTFRRAEEGQAGPRTEEHNGALSLSHSLTRAVRLSGAAGVRTASLNGHPETERYVAATAAAEGTARPGWRLGASLSHSVNWLPGAGARPIDSFQSNTQMRLAPGLDVNGNLTLSAVRQPATQADTTGARSRTEWTMQSGVGARATPLRSVTLDANLSRYRAGGSLTGGGSATTVYSTNLMWRSSRTLQVNGGWGVTTGPGSTNRSFRSTIQWSPSPSFQATGSYSRSTQARRDPTAPVTAGREDYSGTIVMALTRNLHGTIRYGEVDPGLPRRVRQLGVTLAQAFGR